MNYIYDILVNFNDKEIYNFYEWEKTDNIEHLRRIPIFKIDSKTLKDFKNNRVKVCKDFIFKIKNKTELFHNKIIEFIEYASIFTDGSDLIIIEFSKDGEQILRSSMLLDEAEDALDESDLMLETHIDYEIIEKLNYDEFKTRNERKILNYIKKELNLLIKSKKYEKLKYLYFEWYNKKEDNVNKIIEGLNKILKLDFSSKHTKFFELIKFSNMKKQL